MAEQTAKQTETSKDVYYSGNGVTIYSFTLQGVICTTSQISITGQAIVEFTYPKQSLEENTEEDGMIELKTVSLEEAKTLVRRYVKAHPGAWTSDIWYDLELDPELVEKALSELKAEGKIKTGPIRA